LVTSGTLFITPEDLKTKETYLTPDHGNDPFENDLLRKLKWLKRFINSKRRMKKQAHNHRNDIMVMFVNMADDPNY
jgi:hypothetical protein